MTSPEPRPNVHVDRPDADDLGCAVLALHGIFWALNMLVIHRVADDVAHEPDARDGIDQLIMAGQLITEPISERL